jgi:hypothetical protein
MHSTASDGVLSPTELVRVALDRRINVIALTDHDTTNGIQEARQAAKDTPLDVIAGIELGCENGYRGIDILGYCLDIDNSEFQNTLIKMRTQREYRAESMIEKLAKLGIEIPLERVMEVADGASVTRPHIAKVMLEVGAIETFQEAFDKYIGDDGPAYAARFRLTPQAAIDLIHSAGGVAVLAHPGRYENPLTIVEEFVGYGLDGVEVFYPTHEAELRKQLLTLAKRHNLIPTGGTDFHRPDNEGKIFIGTELVPYSSVEAIRRKATSPV